NMGRGELRDGGSLVSDLLAHHRIDVLQQESDNASRVRLDLGPKAGREKTQTRPYARLKGPNLLDPEGTHIRVTILPYRSNVLGAIPVSRPCAAHRSAAGSDAAH